MDLEQALQSLETTRMELSNELLLRAKDILGRLDIDLDSIAELCDELEIGHSDNLAQLVIAYDKVKDEIMEHV